MAQPSNHPVGVDNTFRRKFDREEYLQRAREREEQEADGRFKSKSKGPPVQRKPLKHRDYEVDLNSRLGKTQAGYFCSVCECVVKDSANFLDHINGKKHQRALGMSMRVERSSLEQVVMLLSTAGMSLNLSFREWCRSDLNVSRSAKIQNLLLKKKEKAAEEEPELDPDVAAMMGFGGFGSSKK
ncbi:hypothetical protein RHSIM_Rhsim11G0094200 [Rhododendron simsii]|uniref:U1-type domain-containing protein n=1 Tax=Rhododendron simsii TaxID=118357 RepID=A0A834LA89_RHOSS|nr:hypothetical protein RHSIM_Rhsim11G0094200 [Rhododendron simsii]